MHGDWRFGRQTARSMDLWGKGVGAVVKHELGIVRGGCLDAQVTEHGVRFPAAKQLDSVGTDVGTQERSGAARAKRARGEEVEGYAGCRLEALGSVAKGIRDVERANGVPAGVARARIVVSVNGCVGRRVSKV